MDMTSSLVAKSDQLNAVDLPVPRTFTIEDVTAGSADQPFNFHLLELPGRPYRPSKGMRRVLARGWGAQQIESRYPGRRLTLWCNPEVRWAGAPVGGIQVSHLSDIAEPFTMPLRISQKQTVQYTVSPLPAAVVVGSITDQNELRDLWNTRPDLQDAIKARVNELKETT